MTDPSLPSAAPDGSDGTVLNRKAVHSVVCGVLAFASLYVFMFGALVLSFPALTSGIHARREIAAAKGRETGDSVAVIGLMIGAGALVTYVVSTVLDQLAA